MDEQRDSLINQQADDNAKDEVAMHVVRHQLDIADTAGPQAPNQLVQRVADQRTFGIALIKDGQGGLP